MKHTMQSLIKSVRCWLWSLRRYVILDPADNSVTLSRLLFSDMQQRAPDDAIARVFVFRVPKEQTYGFILGSPRDEPTQLCDIQYNAEHRCIGFETLCPSVGTMLYEWQLPAMTRCKLSVSLRYLPDGRACYTFVPPKKIRHAVAAGT